MGCEWLLLPWVPPVWLMERPQSAVMGSSGRLEQGSELLLSRDPKEVEERRACI